MAAEEKEKKVAPDGAGDSDARSGAAADPGAAAGVPASGPAADAQAILAEGQAPAGAAPAVKRPRSRGVVSAGVAYIKASFNNTIVSITDLRGSVIAWSSAGRAGFKGSRKSTAFAATMVAQDAARQAIGRGMHEVEVRVQGAGSGRESAIRALQSAGLSISMIRDMTPMPHNGCRPRKRRRV
jgi:small subunit ribosomal protein S11